MRETTGHVAKPISGLIERAFHHWPNERSTRFAIRPGAGSRHAHFHAAALFAAAHFGEASSKGNLCGRGRVFPYTRLSQVFTLVPFVIHRLDLSTHHVSHSRLGHHLNGIIQRTVASYLVQSLSCLCFENISL